MVAGKHCDFIWQLTLPCSFEMGYCIQL